MGCITELCYGILLQNDISEFIQGIVLGNRITELCYGIILWDYDYEEGPRDPQGVHGAPRAHPSAPRHAWGPPRTTKQLYLHKCTAPEALDCRIRSPSLERSNSEHPGNHFIMQTARTGLLWVPWHQNCALDLLRALVPGTPIIYRYIHIYIYIYSHSHIRMYMYKLIYTNICICTYTHINR